jgi:hypothetical protein
MIKLQLFALYLAEQTRVNPPVSNDEFVLRALIGGVALVIFITVCCIAWRTVPILKSIIPVKPKDLDD